MCLATDNEEHITADLVIGGRLEDVATELLVRRRGEGEALADTTTYVVTVEYLPDGLYMKAVDLTARWRRDKVWTGEMGHGRLASLLQGEMPGFPVSEAIARLVDLSSRLDALPC